MRLKDNEKVSDIATYHPPFITGVLDGQPVKILSTGNATGHSPVLQFVDQDGRIGWTEEKDITVHDSNAMPPSGRALSNAAGKIRGKNE